MLRVNRYILISDKLYKEQHIRILVRDNMQKECLNILKLFINTFNKYKR
jgi:hypothetical protein